MHNPIDAELQPCDGPAQATSKSVHVRAVFQDVPRYLSRRRVDIRIRAVTVREFASRVRWTTALDVGCGNGSISLPLLTRESHLMLLDISANMIDVARSNVPSGLAENVEFRNEDFMAAAFEPESLDLIVSVGVAAHVDSPEKFVAKIATLLRSGGSLIIQLTDSQHPMGRLERFLGQLKETMAPPRYRTNALSFAEVNEMFRKHGLVVRSMYRYAAIPVPGIETLLPPGILYGMINRIFGDCTNNRNAWLGNEYLCLLTKA